MNPTHGYPKAVIREARPEDAEGIARVHVATWQTAYAGLMPPEFLSSRRPEDRAPMWKDTILKNDGNCRWVAEISGRIVGLLAGGQERSGDLGYDGELYAIYVLDCYQGQGLGKALMNRFMKWLKDHQYRSMVLWVLRDNHPSRRFYERMGGALLSHEKEAEFGGKKLIEVAYGYSLSDPPMT